MTLIESLNFSKKQKNILDKELLYNCGFSVCMYVIKAEGCYVHREGIIWEGNRKGQRGEERGVLKIFYEMQNLDFYLSYICDMKADYCLRKGNERNGGYKQSTTTTHTHTHTS